MSKLLEEWKPVNGYEDFYEISSFGRIFSKRLKKNCKLSGCKNGYLKIGLRCKEGKQKTFLVHRLVAEAFIQNPDNKPCVDHINGNRQDNKIENLRWCTHEENNNFELAKHNQQKSKLAEKNPMYKKKPWNYGVEQTEELREINRKSHTGLIYPSRRKKVVQIESDGTIIHWETACAAESHGFSQGHISACCNGKYNKIGNHHYKGSDWYFEEDYEKMLGESNS